jgi:hypothetical protein
MDWHCFTFTINFAFVQFYVAREFFEVLVQFDTKSVSAHRPLF